ncbi:glycoside hydrolase family 75 protein [Granulicella paludicola]|uniref:glycoside hydrolase family 75 protein n=1 Tax=Granulicella paludicola TaxID=474951 RepID=UPI0021DFE398|nr:glycoside hydrolase family 75 protein [Granulicella paludicola]
MRTAALTLALLVSSTAYPLSLAPSSFELLTHRMDVDVDGAPNAYGPAGSRTLDVLSNAHYRARPKAEIVGYLTDDDNPKLPILQGPHDPFPGLYISQTAFTDPHLTDPRNVRRYVDATKINYIVRGNAAKRHGVQLGDFVAVYSKRTHRAVFGIVADDGNPSGDEGSLHLLQSLGYPFRNGTDDAVEGREIIIRFYPHSNPQQLFFRTQAALDEAALKLGVSRDFDKSTDGKSRLHP